MTKSNVEMFREYIEQVINAKRLDLLDEFFSPEFIFHNPPFVGMGIVPDSSSGERLIVREVVPRSPADGRLQAGDEIVAASDASGSWTTFKALKNAEFGRGKPGTQVTVTVRRGGNTVEVPITRGHVPGGKVPYSMTAEMYRSYLTQEWPDLKSEINLLIAEGDLVAYFITNSGTNADYGQAAVWTESGFARLKDGKFTEWWFVSDDISQMKQLGYQVKQPEETEIRS